LAILTYEIANWFALHNHQASRAWGTHAISPHDLHVPASFPHEQPMNSAPDIRQWRTNFRRVKAQRQRKDQESPNDLKVRFIAFLRLSTVSDHLG